MEGPTLLRDASGRWLRQGAEASLRNLRTDYIDLYQVHWPDPRTPPEGGSVGSIAAVLPCHEGLFVDALGNHGAGGIDAFDQSQSGGMDWSGRLTDHPGGPDWVPPGVVVSSQKGLKLSRGLFISRLLCLRAVNRLQTQHWLAHTNWSDDSDSISIGAVAYADRSAWRPMLLLRRRPIEGRRCG